MPPSTDVAPYCTLQIGQVTATLDEDGTWHCDEPSTALALNAAANPADFTEQPMNAARAAALSAARMFGGRLTFAGGDGPTEDRPGILY